MFCDECYCSTERKIQKNRALHLVEVGRGIKIPVVLVSGEILAGVPGDGQEGDWEETGGELGWLLGDESESNGQQPRNGQATAWIGCS